MTLMAKVSLIHIAMRIFNAARDKKSDLYTEIAEEIQKVLTAISA